MQNENGPCPLLAIANILLLQGAVTIHPDCAHISSEDLLQHISDYLFKRLPKERSDNYAQNLQDCISIFPKLTVGLDVNVRFRNVRDFEFTADIVVFDLLGINLIHGWLVDPTCAHYNTLKEYSYNKAMEKIVAMQALTHTKSKEHVQSNSQNTITEDDKGSDNDGELQVTRKKKETS